MVAVVHFVYVVIIVVQGGVMEKCNQNQIVIGKRRLRNGQEWVHPVLINVVEHMMVVVQKRK